MAQRTILDTDYRKTEEVLGKGFVLEYMSPAKGTQYLKTRAKYPSIDNMTGDLSEAAFFDSKEGTVEWCLWAGSFSRHTISGYPLITKLIPVEVEVVMTSEIETTSFVTKRRKYITFPVNLINGSGVAFTGEA